MADKFKYKELNPKLKKIYEVLQNTTKQANSIQSTIQNTINLINNSNFEGNVKNQLIQELNSISQQVTEIVNKANHYIKNDTHLKTDIKAEIESVIKLLDQYNAQVDKINALADKVNFYQDKLNTVRSQTSNGGN